MIRANRQALSLLALVIAGASSLATSQAPGAVVFDEPWDRLSFSADHRVEVRHVRFVVVGGKDGVDVTADVPIEVGAVDGKRPVTLSVVRDSDGESVLDDFGPDYQAGTGSSLAGHFVAIESCPSGQTCSENFTFTFERIAEDTRPSLAFDWSISSKAEYPGSTPPPGASLEVTISP